jgi:hypothetical protein
MCVCIYLLTAFLTTSKYHEELHFFTSMFPAHRTVLGIAGSVNE